MRRISLHITLLLSLTLQPVFAQATKELAQDAVQQLDAAAQQLKAASKAKDRVAALTATVRAYEQGLVAIRDSLRRVTITQSTLEKQVDARRGEISHLLGVLQTVERSPKSLLVLHPDGPLGTARSGMILADVTPALQSQAERLRNQFNNMQNLHVIHEQAKKSLQNGLEGAQKARSALSIALQKRQDLPRRFAEDKTKVLQLLNDADTLAAFASGLEETFLQNTSTPTTANSIKGGLFPPVQGQLIRDFGQADAAGVVRSGVILATRPRAIVTTPIAATILFRGPLLDYGNVVIVEPAAQVLFVFSGLDTAYGTPGQVIPAGSPIGEMGGDIANYDVNVNDFDQNFSEQFTQSLYLEVRERQTPVNPATWFALQ